MNKLLLNQSARNHIKMYPMKDIFELPEDEGEKIVWCERKFNELQHSDDAERLFIKKNKNKGYLVSVWQLHDLYYLVNCVRTNTHVYITTIYITKDGGDAINIAKFLYQNVEEIMQDTKQSLLDYHKIIMEKAEDIKGGDA